MLECDGVCRETLARQQRRHQSAARALPDVQRLGHRPEVGLRARRERGAQRERGFSLGHRPLEHPRAGRRDCKHASRPGRMPPLLGVVLVDADPMRAPVSNPAACASSTRPLAPNARRPRSAPVPALRKRVRPCDWPCCRNQAHARGAVDERGVERWRAGWSRYQARATAAQSEHVLENSRAASMAPASMTPTVSITAILLSKRPPVGGS